MTQKSDGPAHKAHSRSKPKFELPIDKNERDAAAAWVHRTSERAEKLHKPETHKPAASEQKETASTTSTFVSLGIMLMAASFVVSCQVSLTALGIFTAPVRWGRRLLPI